MNATKLNTLSLSELKSICSDRGIAINGDKRAKVSYIREIIAFEQRTVITKPIDSVEPSNNPSVELTPPIPTESAPLPTPRHASIAMLVPIVFAIIMCLSVKTAAVILVQLLSAIPRIKKSIIIPNWSFNTLKTDTLQTPSLSILV